MVRKPQHRSHQHQPELHDRSGELLQNLLQSPVPDEDPSLRPVALLSTSEQRRQALKPFRLFTWVDRALYQTERLLLLALIGFFAFWLLDGYGRDWLHAQGYLEQPTAVPAEPLQPGDMVGAAVLTDTLITVEAGTGAISWYTRSADGTAFEHTSVLPFVPADMQQEPGMGIQGSAFPDYIAPRDIRVPQVRVDPRPQHLIIPAIDIDTPVQEIFIQDGVWQVAEYAAGYHHNTALPGETGNTVLSGHAGLRGAVFRRLGTLQPGDEVLLEAGNWRYHYEVRQVFSVWPTQVEVMAPTETPTLTLITCTAWDTQRLVVVADLVDSRPL